MLTGWDAASACDAVVTIRLASGNPLTLHAPTIGAAWLAVAPGFVHPVRLGVLTAETATPAM